MSSRPRGARLKTRSLLPEDARGRCAVSVACGGCPQIENRPTEVHEKKAEQLLKLFHHAGCLAPSVRLFEQVSPLGYRNRIRLRVFDDGSFGFFNAHKSAECLVLEPALRQLLATAQERLARVRSALRSAQHLELRSFDLDGHAGLYLAPRQNPAQEASLLREAEQQIAEAFSGVPILVGGLTGEKLPEQRFLLRQGVFQYVPLGGFMQVNHRINASLLEWVSSCISAYGGRSVVDLYCGSGNFLLHLLAEGHDGLGVESNSSSIASARRAALEQGLSGRFVADRVENWCKTNQEWFDIALVDAPRAGLKDAVLDVARLGASRLVLVSCNPKSLVRDVSRLTQLGYSAQAMSAFDMFAYTNHVEVGVFMVAS